LTCEQRFSIIVRLYKSDFDAIFLAIPRFIICGRLFRAGGADDFQRFGSDL
jgi:hypothetical protein